jgi:hypothetical protein
MSYQQSAIAHAYVDSADDVRATFVDMCSSGTGAQCRSYFVLLSLNGYATHALFDDHDKRCLLFMDYITYQGVTQDVAKQMMLQDLERLVRKSHSSLEKFGFPTPDNVPTELEEAISLWMQPDVIARQRQLLDGLVTTHPNNDEQQMTFISIMNSIIDFKDVNRDDII